MCRSPLPLCLLAVTLLWGCGDAPTDPAPTGPDVVATRPAYASLVGPPGGASVIDFEDVGAVVNEAPPPITLDGVTVTFDNLVFAYWDDDTNGFGYQGLGNVVVPEDQEFFSGFSLTAEGVGWGQRRPLGFPRFITFDTPLPTVGMYVADIDVLEGITAVAYDGDWNELDRQVFPASLGRDGQVTLIEFNAPGIQKVILLGNDPIGIDNLYFIPEGIASIACGITLTEDFVLDGDLTCPPGFTDPVFTLAADDITLDGGGHTITAPEAGIVSVVGQSGVTVKNLVVADGAEPGLVGIRLHGVSNSTIENNTINDRQRGLESTGASQNNIYRDNTFRAHSVAGLDLVGEGHTIEGNDLSGNVAARALYIHDGGPSTVAPDNVFDGSGAGIALIKVSGMEIRNLTFPGSVGTAFSISASDGLLFEDIAIQGSGTGYGFSLGGVTNSKVQRVSIANREFAVRGHRASGNDNLEFISNTFTDNEWGIALQGNGVTLAQNHLERNVRAVYLNRATGPADIRDDNHFDDSGTAIRFTSAQDFTLQDLTIPASVGVGVSVSGSSGMTFRNLTIEGSGQQGYGFNIVKLSDSDFENVRISDREIAIRQRTGPNDDLRFTNNAFSNNGDAVWVRGSRSIWNGNVLEGNTRGIRVLSGTDHQILDATLTNNSVGVESQTSGSVEIHQSLFSGNTNWGVFNGRSDVVVDAEDNYWGDKSGPLDEDVPVDGLNDNLGLSNPSGLGDAVTDFVDYDPWVKNGNVGGGGGGEPTMVWICHFNPDHQTDPWTTGAGYTLAGDYVLQYVGPDTPLQDQQDRCENRGGMVQLVTENLAKTLHEAQLLSRISGYPDG